MNLPLTPYLNTQSLSKIFDNMSESYKIFWFKAILEKVGEGKFTITYDELINTMIKYAWYMVTEFKLNLGPSDTLEKLIYHIHDISKIKPAEKPDVIFEYIENAKDKDLLDMKKTLIKNVPYRLQSVFMPEISSSIWSSCNSTIEYINIQEGLIYNISQERGLNRRIIINELWAEYIKKNLGILHGWVDFNLINYLQRRNPSVPGISNKIYPPRERNLSAVKAYWKAIINTAPVNNIYTGEIMTIDDISIDHFVPWSYVAHDELWNLVPTTKGINSSKNNNLPEWNIYFPRLCKVEYQAYKLVEEYDHMKDLHRVVTKCMKDHVNSQDVRYKLYRPGQPIHTFASELEELIKPAYESAKNLGFGQWRI
ncbi:MAG: HNH endonuclease domain-containing protein [Eubacteriales bacterium]|nr:HNH endonuclease domain-containing protein [Eubacteriales bacterium]